MNLGYNPYKINYNIGDDLYPFQKHSSKHDKDKHKWVLNKHTSDIIHTYKE